MADVGSNCNHVLLDRLFPDNQLFVDMLCRFDFGFMECDSSAIRWVVEKINMPSVSHGVIKRIRDEFLLFGDVGFAQLNFWRYKQGRFLDCRCSYNELIRYFQMLIQRARGDQVTSPELNRCALFVLVLIRVRELAEHKASLGEISPVRAYFCQHCI